MNSGPDLPNVNQFDIKRQPSIRRNLTTSTTGTIPVNEPHPPLKRGFNKTSQSRKQDNKILQLTYPIDGGIVSFLLSPTRMPVEIQKNLRSIQHDVHFG